MTLTIPTGEFCGLLSDVVPFACPDDNYPDYCSVRLEWDGTQLHAMATDTVSIGLATWDQDDGPAVDRQEDLFTVWGGADEPASVLIPLAVAKKAVSTYKLPTKAMWTPLLVDITEGTGLRVQRHKNTGYSAITEVVDALVGQFPDVRETLALCSQAEPTRGVVLDAKRLARFAKVRPRGPMRLAFSPQPGPVGVRIGDRFQGAIMPYRPAQEPKRADEREAIVA